MTDIHGPQKEKYSMSQAQGMDCDCVNSARTVELFLVTDLGTQSCDLILDKMCKQVPTH